MGKRKRAYFCWAIVKETVRKFFADNGLFLASGLSFDLLLYCMPLSLLLVSGLGYTLVESDQAVAWVHETLQNFLPGSQQAFFDALDRIITNRGPLGIGRVFGIFYLNQCLIWLSSNYSQYRLSRTPSEILFEGKIQGFFSDVGGLTFTAPHD